MNKFNKLFCSIIENTSSILGGPPDGSAQYAPGDMRPIEPAKIVLGAKARKGKNKRTKQQTTLIQRRPAIEKMFS